MLNFPFKRSDNSNVSKWSSNSSLRKNHAPHSHPMEKIRTYSVPPSAIPESAPTKKSLATTSFSERKKKPAPAQPTKSNLDIFIDLTSNPFTTKFEIIGSTSNRVTKPTKNENLSTDYLGTPTNSSINNLFNVSSSSRCDLNESNDGAFTDIWPDRVEKLYQKPPNTTHNNSNFLTVTQNIYTGGMSSIKNERKMCRLGIEYLVDMSNMRPDELNRHTLGKLPCLCKQQHSRLYLSVSITETSFKSLFAAFSEVNKFIQKAKRSNSHKNKVLLFGKECLSQQVICACCQYLMVEYQMSLSQALQLILQKNSSGRFRLETCYRNYLEQLQNYLKHLSTTMYPVPDLANLWPLRDTTCEYDDESDTDSEPAEETIQFEDHNRKWNAGCTVQKGTRKKSLKIAWM